MTTRTTEGKTETRSTLTQNVDPTVLRQLMWIIPPCTVSGHPCELDRVLSPIPFHQRMQPVGNLCSQNLRNKREGIFCSWAGQHGAGVDHGEEYPVPWHTSKYHAYSLSYSGPGIYEICATEHTYTSHAVSVQYTPQSKRRGIRFDNVHFPRLLRQPRSVD